MMPIRIGVAGVGRMGQNHCRILHRLPNVRFVAVFDTNEDVCGEVARRYDVAACTSFSSLLSKVDAVVIAVPTTHHFTYASQALELGKDVLIEKPLVKTLSECEDLDTLQNRQGAIVQVGHIERFNPVVSALKGIIATDQLVSVETYRCGPSKRSLDIDVVLDLMIHDIDILMDIVPSPVSAISAQGVCLTSHLDVAMALLTFENGVTANLIANRLGQRKARNLCATGQNMTVLADYSAQEVYVYRPPMLQQQNGYAIDSVIETVKVDGGNALENELLHFVSCVQNRQLPAIGIPEAKKALNIATLIKQSMKMSESP